MESDRQSLTDRQACTSCVPHIPQSAVPSAHPITFLLQIAQDKYGKSFEVFEVSLCAPLPVSLWENVGKIEPVSVTAHSSAHSTVVNVCITSP